MDLHGVLIHPLAFRLYESCPFVHLSNCLLVWLSNTPPHLQPHFVYSFGLCSPNAPGHTVFSTRHGCTTPLQRAGITHSRGLGFMETIHIRIGPPNSMHFI